MGNPGRLFEGLIDEHGSQTPERQKNIFISELEGLINKINNSFSKNLRSAELIRKMPVKKESVHPGANSFTFQTDEEFSVDIEIRNFIAQINTKILSYEGSQNALVKQKWNEFIPKLDTINFDQLTNELRTLKTELLDILNR